ncbi:uncharacterized protein LOC110814629 isoform X2 [Carica papaya]|uniref:uncharacterized protein LOC110814629 isoform X2 n=1 Tax=Carica papaya TaxID=3649 RepID=UPI000B8C7CF1|nr:uncharacterized protein LOC110814629 isoform X2 [Carica papaya]
MLDLLSFLDPGMMLTIMEVPPGFFKTKQGAEECRRCPCCYYNFCGQMVGSKRRTSACHKSASARQKDFQKLLLLSKSLHFRFVWDVSKIGKFLIIMLLVVYAIFISLFVFGGIPQPCT